MVSDAIIVIASLSLDDFVFPYMHVVYKPGLCWHVKFSLGCIHMHGNLNVETLGKREQAVIGNFFFLLSFYFVTRVAPCPDHVFSI